MPHDLALVLGAPAALGVVGLGHRRLVGEEHLMMTEGGRKGGGLYSLMYNGISGRPFTNSLSQDPFLARDSHNGSA